MTHALNPTSPALDSGNPGIVNFPRRDQRGVARIQDGDGNLSTIIDMGAYETTLAVTVDTDSPEVNDDFSPGDLSLPEALGLVASGGTVDFDPSVSSGVITLTEPDNFWYGPNGLRPIDKTVTLEGDGVIIERDPASPDFRFFYVPGSIGSLDPGTLTLRNLTLLGGSAVGGDGGAGGEDGGTGGGGGGAGLGGAIFNQGVLNVDNVIFDQNQALGGTGGDGFFDASLGGGGGGGLGGDGGGGAERKGGGGGGGDGADRNFDDGVVGGGGGGFEGDDDASDGAGIGGGGDAFDDGGTSPKGGDGGQGDEGFGGGGGGGFGGGDDGQDGSVGGLGGTGGGDGGRSPITQFLYGVEAAESDWGLHIIDPSDATASFQGDTGQYMTGLAFHQANGLLYGSGANIGDHQGLLLVDPLAVTATPIGSGYGITRTLADIAYDPISGSLYGWQVRSDGDLHIIDEVTGIATLVGDSGLSLTGGNGLAFDDQGTLFLAGEGTNGLLRTIDKTTGLPIRSVALTGIVSGHQNINSLAFKDGLLYGVMKSDLILISIDPATGQITPIGPITPFQDIDGIEFVPVGASGDTGGGGAFGGGGAGGDFGGGGGVGGGGGGGGGTGSGGGGGFGGGGGGGQPGGDGGFGGGGGGGNSPGLGGFGGGDGASANGDGGAAGGAGGALGGAIFVHTGTATIVGSSFFNNQAFGGTGGDGEPPGDGGFGGDGLGGAIFLDTGGSLDLSESEFDGNDSSGGFGGFSSSVQQAPGEGKGGALYVRDGASVTTGSGLSYSSNSASDPGGTINDNDDTFGLVGPSLTVTTPDDDDNGDLSFGDLSLREAINNARDFSTIDFDPSLYFGGPTTIDMNSGLGRMDIQSDQLAIQGPGASILAVDGLDLSGIFSVPFGFTVHFFDLTLTSGKDATGGAISNLGTLFMTRCDLINNEATDSEGGAIESFGSVDATECDFVNNTAKQGGAILNASAFTLSLTDCTLSGNTADEGGAIYNSLGTMNMTGCTLSGNTASLQGGGIFNDSSDSEIVNSTISGNEALDGSGGGIYSDGSFSDSSMILTNSTVADNRALDGGGGVYNIASGVLTNADLTLNNTIVGDNSSTNTDEEDVDNLDGAVVAFNSLIEFAGTHGLVNGVDGNIVGSDPLLGPLGNNGGLTDTHSLLPLSPVVDSGDNSLVDPGTTTDQRGPGFDRIVDGDGDLSATVDMGAFESPEPADLELTKTTTSGEFDAGGTFVYTITLTNQGPADTFGVTVVDFLSGNLILTDNSPSQGTYTEGTGTWDVGDMASGETAVLTLTVTGIDPFGGFQVDNTAEVTASDTFDFDSTPGNAIGGEDDQETVVLYIRSGLETWRLVYFDPADLQDPTKEATLWGNGADPDFEGIKNLWEYFMGLNPLFNDGAGPEVFNAFLVNGDLVVSYRKSNDTALYSFEIVECTTDLAGFSGCGGSPTVVQDNGDHSIIEVAIPLSGEEILLVRLRIVEGISEP